MPQKTRDNPQELSGLREVSYLKLVDGPSHHTNGKPRTEFEKNIRIDKRDFGAIEFLLRKGRRQLDMYASPGVKDIR
jgi:hypothetical protein